MGYQHACSIILLDLGFLVVLFPDQRSMFRPNPLIVVEVTESPNLLPLHAYSLIY
jgi:hypothetical protein